MEIKEKYKIGFYRFMSYLSAFMYGAYCDGVMHGKEIKPHQWVITGFFGIYFFIMSLRKKED